MASSYKFTDALGCDKDFACTIFTFRDTLLSVSEQSDYRRTLETATAELSGLIEEAEELDDRRDKLTNRISALRDIVFALSNVLGIDPKLTYPELYPESIEPETGFTDAIREVLKSSNKYLSPVDIRNELRERGFNLMKYRNPLAAIHQILKRLAIGNEIEKHPDEEKKLYRWSNKGIRVLGSTASGGTRVLGSTAGTGVSAQEDARPRLARPKPGNGGDPKPVGAPWDIPLAPPKLSPDYLKQKAMVDAEKKDLKK